MNEIKDKNDITLKDGDVIDIHQTVNGQNKFIVLKLNNLDIRYLSDIRKAYEYDKEALLAPDKYTGETTFEIIDNIGVLHAK